MSGTTPKARREGGIWWDDFVPAPGGPLSSDKMPLDRNDGSGIPYYAELGDLGDVELAVGELFNQATPSTLAPGDEVVVEREGSRFRGSLNAAALRWFDVSDVAVGDNTADDTSALQALHNAAGADGLVYYPPGFVYKTTDTITVPNGQSVVMYSPIIYDPAVNGYTRPGLVIGQVGASNEMMGKKLRLWVQFANRPQSGNDYAWADANAGCIVLRNLRRCSDVRIVYVRNGYFGVKLEGAGSGAGTFSYCDVSAEQITNCRVPLWVETSGTTGWVNQNSIFLNQVRNDTNTGPGLSRTGIRFSSTGDNTAMNSNIVWGASFELNPPGSEDCIPFELDSLQDCEFRRIRSEASAPVYLVKTGSKVVSNNLIEIIHASDNESIAVDQSAATNNGVYILDRGGQSKVKWETVYDSGNLGDKWYDYNGSGSLGLRDWVIWETGSGPTQSARLHHTGTIAGADYFGFSGTTRGLVARVDFLSGRKQLRIDRSYVAGHEGRIGIQCFLQDGTLLDNTATPAPFDARRRAGTSVIGQWSTSFGGYFREGSTTGNRPYYLTFRDDVAYIHVIFTLQCRIRSIAIAAIDGAQVRFRSPDGPDRSALFRSIPERLATASPSVGTWQQGTRLVNPEASSAGKIGRVCLSNGTASTISTTGDITTGTAVLEVASATGLEVGQYISIAGVTGTKRVVRVDGDIVTIDSNANATVEDAAVANVAPTWETYGAID